MLAFLRLLAWSFITAAIVIAALGGAGYWLYRDAQRPGPLAAARSVVIPAHTGVAGIADLLARNGVIRYPLAFRLLARLSGRGGELKAGEYRFPAAASERDALDIVASGRTVRHFLTIPEGLTSLQVVALVRAAPALEGAPGPVPPEGALLPDTYAYRYGESREALLARMRRSMAHLVAELWRQRRKGVPLASPEQAVILASIVEKETARPEERAHIAGVYLNRLRLGMKLQADPSVLFAVDQPALAKAGGKTQLDRPLTHADLAIESPYNTYRVKGLPPGPIDNPGRASLLAALQPEPTEDLYFVADGSGGHVFAKTLADQSRHVAQYHRAVLGEPDPRPPVPPVPPMKPVAPVAAAAHAAHPAHARRIPSHLHRAHLDRAAQRRRHAASLRRCRRQSDGKCRR